MNILIMEAYTDANIGSCALVENTLRILSRKYPHANIRLMAHAPKAFESLYNVPTVHDTFKYPFGRNRLVQLIWALKTLTWMLLVCLQLLFCRRLFLFQRKLQDYLWADWVISVGAERINDKYFKNILFSLFTYWMVKRLGKTMILFPATIGPFLFGWSRRLCAIVFRSVDLIFTRDDMSAKLALQLKSLTSDKIVNTSDVAVLQDWCDSSQARRLLNVSESQQLVGVSVLKWTYFRNSEDTPYSNYNAYLQEMTSLIGQILARYPVTIILYPTNFPVHGCRENDLEVALEIYSRIPDKTRVSIVNTLHPPHIFKGLLACSEINITTRMHACILSTGAGVPTLSINYLFKLSEYMKSLGLSKYSFDIEHFNAADTFSSFEAMWNSRGVLRQHLHERIDAKKTHLLNSMEALDALAG